MNYANILDNPTPAKTRGFARAAGKPLLITVAGLTAVGGFLADWNKTHLLNPNWPPHAKFHDAMTITLGSFLGSAGLYFLLRKKDHSLQDVQLGALLPAFFWASQGISFIYPGAKGLEAEFPELVPRFNRVWLNEKFAAAGMLGLLAAAYALERQHYPQ